MEKTPLGLTEGCSAISCSSLPSPKPVGFLPAVKFGAGLDFENIDMARLSYWFFGSCLLLLTEIENGR